MDRRARLEWLRDELVSTWADAVPKERAGLAKQLRDTMAELDALPPAERVGDPVDDFSARLAARRTAAADQGATAAGGKSRARSR
jgi:hypothetical protein